MNRRLVVRWVPGFTWVQFALRRPWTWDPTGFWSVRGIAWSRSYGFLWVCTMREDCVERAKRDGLFP